VSTTRRTRPTSGHRRREAERRKRRRQTTLVVIGGVAVVVVVALLIATTTGGSSSGTTVPSGQDAADIVRTVTSVPLSVAGPIGSGSAAAPPTKLTGAPLTKNGKPEVLYIGAEYCPFCATERWPLVVALSRFGTFSNLAFTESSGSDVYPNTPTFTFRDATFTSPYVEFTPVETADRSGNPLSTPSADQLATWRTLDPSGTIPFINIGGEYLINRATYDPGVLQGNSAKQIADALNDPNSPIAKGVLGAANDITAAICTTTNNQPADVCNAPTIKAIQDQLG
jgi:Domain of unknown function (DUF929)